MALRQWPPLQPGHRLSPARPSRHMLCASSLPRHRASLPSPSISPRLPRTRARSWCGIKLARLVYCLQHFPTSARLSCVQVREAIGDLLCIALRLHPAGGLEAMTTLSDTVPATVADLAASELASMLKSSNLRALRQPVMRTCLRLVQVSECRLGMART